MQYTPAVSPIGSVIHLAGVAARAGSTPILRDIDLDVDPGEAVGLYGANGAGKTTLLRVLASLHPPLGGVATVFEADLHSTERYEVRRRIGMIGHTPALYGELSLLANLEYVAAVAGLPSAAAADALETVGLYQVADREVDASSHGMQRRCEIARELMLAPDLLLLDEPHSALDESAVALVDHLVMSVTDRGGAVVVASHDRNQVDRITQCSVVLARGTLDD